MDKLLLRPEECANSLGIGRSKLYQLLASRRLESLTIGRRRLIPREALLAFVERERREQRVVDDLGEPDR